MKLSGTMIHGKKLSIGYQNGKQIKYVHRNLNFELRQGELTCLLGANGAGKSTLLRTLAAAQPALEGTLEFLGKPISAYTERERSRLIGIVLTDKTQAGGLAVYELVALGRQPHTGFFGRLHRSDKEKIEHALQAVGMEGKKQCYVAELSDGERQKVMIAKALVQECPLILLDEPTAFLDVVSRIEIMNLLHRLAVEEKRAILLSTHDVEQALVLSDRLWLLTPENGLECGVTEDLILSHRMDTLFNQTSGHIRFDLMHGVFSPMVEGKKSIVLQTEDDVLRHWTQNALNRINYFCLTAETLSDVSVILEVVSPRELILKMNGQQLVLHSFEELLAVLP